MEGAMFTNKEIRNMPRINSYQMTWKLRATVALVLALALSTFPATFSRAVKAQTPAKATAQTPAKTPPSPAGESKGGPKEGIKVHGHWAVDVRNPDGTLVTHREFENALTTEGKIALMAILGRIVTPGLWEIEFLSFGTSPWTHGSGLINEQNDPNAPTVYRSKNLFLCSADLGGSPTCADGQPVPPVGTFLLRGSLVAERNGTINEVATSLRLCQDSQCSGFQGFTDYVLQPLGTCPPNAACYVNVVATQIIQVTVAISFS
jgi:hypothetical protein